MCIMRISKWLNRLVLRSIFCGRYAFLRGYLRLARVLTSMSANWPLMVVNVFWLALLAMIVNVFLVDYAPMRVNGFVTA